MQAAAGTAGVSQETLDLIKKQRTLGYQIKKSKSSYFMLAPYFIMFFFFTVLPVVMSVAFSFTYYNMLEMPEFVGWKNYIKLFLEDDIFMVSLKNTLILAVVTGPVSYFLCLLFCLADNFVTSAFCLQKKSTHFFCGTVFYTFQIFVFSLFTPFDVFFLIEECVNRSFSVGKRPHKNSIMDFFIFRTRQKHHLHHRGQR